MLGHLHFIHKATENLNVGHKTLKQESIRPHCPVSLEDARRIVDEYVEHYNNVRLHSAIGYVAPKVKLEGYEKQIFAGT